ncbi:MAG: hypothetical protein JWQ35_2419 [Bacteriovoracaceae bacterium]|nr:hypothetical protein [Bacteriovoracaceae bacterium]
MAWDLRTNSRLYWIAIFASLQLAEAAAPSQHLSRCFTFMNLLAKIDRTVAAAHEKISNDKKAEAHSNIVDLLFTSKIQDLISRKHPPTFPQENKVNFLFKEKEKSLLNLIRLIARLDSSHPGEDEQPFYSALMQRFSPSKKQEMSQALEALGDLYIRYIPEDSKWTEAFPHPNEIDLSGKLRMAIFNYECALKITCDPASRLWINHKLEPLKKARTLEIVASMLNQKDKLIASLGWNIGEDILQFTQGIEDELIPFLKQSDLHELDKNGDLGALYLSASYRVESLIKKNKFSAALELLGVLYSSLVYLPRDLRKKYESYGLSFFNIMEKTPHRKRLQNDLLSSFRNSKNWGTLFLVGTIQDVQGSHREALDSYQDSKKLLFVELADSYLNREYGDHQLEQMTQLQKAIKQEAGRLQYYRYASTPAKISSERMTAIMASPAMSPEASGAK